MKSKSPVVLALVAALLAVPVFSWAAAAPKPVTNGGRQLPKKALYEELTPKEFKARLSAAPIAYLPLGTLEWHGEHLPLGSDGLQSKSFFIELARKAGGVVLPMLFMGPDRQKEVGGKPLYGMDICADEHAYPDQQLPGSAYWMERGAFTQYLEGVVAQLSRAGFKVVVAHGHGPSTGLFIRHIPDWSKKYNLKLFTCWRDDDSDGFGIQTDHAAANETSLMMALRPELVQMGNLSKDPAVWPLAVGGKDPRTNASPEVGKKAVAMQVQRMTKLLREALRETSQQRTDESKPGE